MDGDAPFRIDNNDPLIDEVVKIDLCSTDIL